MVAPGPSRAFPTTCGKDGGEEEEDEDDEDDNEEGLGTFLPRATWCPIVLARADTSCSTPPSAMVTCVGKSTAFWFLNKREELFFIFFLVSVCVVGGEQDRCG